MGPRARTLVVLLAAAGCDPGAGQPLGRASGRDAGGAGDAVGPQDVDPGPADSGPPGSDAGTAGDARPGDIGSPRACPRDPPPIEIERAEPDATVFFEPRDLGFRPVRQGATATVTAAFDHEGPDATYRARFEGGDVCTADGAFCVLDPEEVPVTDGERVEIRVRYAPVAPELRHEVLRLDRGDRVQRIATTGRATTTTLLVCGAWDVPEIAPGDSTRTRVTCRNLGAVQVLLHDVDLQVVAGDATAPAPEVTPPAGTADVALDPGDAVIFPVDVCAGSEGAFELALTIEAQTRGPKVLDRITVTATSAVVGARLEAAGSFELTFDNLNRAPVADFQIESTGQRILEITAAEATPPFFLDDFEPMSIEPDDRRWLTVGVTVESAAPRTGTLRLETNDGVHATELIARLADDAVSCATDLELADAIDLGDFGVPEAHFGDPRQAGPAVMEHVFPMQISNPTSSDCRVAFEPVDDVARVQDLHAPPLDDHDPNQTWTLEAERTLSLRVSIADGLTAGPLEGRVLVRDRSFEPARELRVRGQLVSDGPRIQMSAEPLRCGAPAPELSLEILDGESSTGRLRDPSGQLGIQPDGRGFRVALDTCPTDGTAPTLELPWTSGGRAQTLRFPGPISTPANCEWLEAGSFHVDRFSQLRLPRRDVVIVVDDSGSMATFEEALVTQLEAFARFVIGREPDARIAVTGFTDLVERPDPWRPAGDAAPWAFGPEDTSTEGLVRALRELAPWVGDAHETPLDAVVAPSALPLADLRLDALLAIVVVTDEPDASEASVEEALNRLLSIKGYRNTQIFSFSVISGGEEGCTADGIELAPTPRLVELARKSGGVVGTLCDSTWGRTLEDLARYVFGFRSRWFLTHKPHPESIRMFVDDVEVPRTEPSGRINWTYDFRTNSVNFTPLAVPPPGAEVRIEYFRGCA